MDQELQNQLFDKYPQFFTNKDKGIQSSCMTWGCECGNGWYEILASLCWMIRQHEDNKRWQKEWIEKQKKDIQESMGLKIEGEEPDYFPVKFDQIKEKYGGLRIYFSGGDDYVEGLVSMAEAISYKICEVCGNKGECNKSGWFSTLCNTHRESLKNPS